MVLNLIANEILKKIAVAALIIAIVIGFGIGQFYKGHKAGWEAHANQAPAPPQNLRIKSVERDKHDERMVRALENIAGALTDLNNKFVKIAGDPWDE